MEIVKRKQTNKQKIKWTCSNSGWNASLPKENKKNILSPNLNSTQLLISMNKPLHCNTKWVHSQSINVSLNFLYEIWLIIWHFLIRVLLSQRGGQLHMKHLFCLSLYNFNNKTFNTIEMRESEDKVALKIHKRHLNNHKKTSKNAKGKIINTYGK